MQTEQGHKVSQLINHQMDELVKQSVLDIYKNGFGVPLPDKDRYDKSMRDMQYHLTYFSEAVAINDTTLFTDYIAWVDTKFKSLSFSDNILEIIIHSIERTLGKSLSVDAFDFLQPFFQATWQQIAQPIEHLTTYLPDEAPLASLAQSYLQALLQTDRNTAVNRVLAHVKNVEDVKDVYLNVFQPVQYEIGRLWQTNKISVAEEHFCTAVTQLIMSQFYKYIFETPRTGHKLVSASISGELHELGIRMVTDFFEMFGWDTYYLGANTPTESMIQTIADHQPDIVAISATITFHISELQQLIAQIRQMHMENPPKIFVGGYPFIVSKTLWQKVGADGFSTNALQAVKQANQLIST